jgi:hypothetical protein
VGRSRALVAAMVVLALATAAPSAWGAHGFRPRIGRAMGLVPPAGRRAQLRAGDVARGSLTPVTYHGGSVMSGGVTVHTIFWAPAGFAFQGSPGPGIPTYEGLIQQFFTDVAADGAAVGTCGTSDCNTFTVERQYAQGTGVGRVTPGTYSISYAAAADSINATDPYPSKPDQCASPAGAAVCLTDNELTAEVDHLVQSSGGGRGLHNLWFVFLPPGVDECIDQGDCGTSTFAGYHAVANVAGHGATVYAVAIDPITEGPLASGADPQGYPDAEGALITAAHEVNEAVTDPLGNGWMDPNGFEVGDKCEIGPQVGSPLGFATNGSPYNQVINGHQYLLQEEWANADSAGNDDCVQATTTTSSRLPLPQVNLRQFDPLITGNVNRLPGAGIHVQVSLLRAASAGNAVAVVRGSAITQPDGSWQVWLWPHAPGDDRDEIDVDYSGPGAPQPSHQVILTGNGGNPFTEAGWMGWLAMDNGSAITGTSTGSSLMLAPCFQAGTLSYTFDGVGEPQSPNEVCNTETDIATVGSVPAGRADALSWTSSDNRAFDAPDSGSPNLFGGLVSLTVPIGEPGSVSSFTSPLPSFTPGGFPTCQADLELELVGCSGLVPGARYTLTDRGHRTSARADGAGTAVVPMLVRRRDSVRLSNGSRTLTTLHVANLRVKIVGEESFLAGGSCQAGEYYGPPLSAIPTSAGAGLPSPLTTGGVALTGQTCPRSGHAAGLPATNIVQTDELSGGVTETEVPDIEDTSPIEGETVYGRFTALAESGLTLPGNQVLATDLVTRISLQIVTAHGAKVLRIRNVDTPRGVPVPALRPGNYYAIWTLTDLNGDTRIAATRFIEARGKLGPKPRTKVALRFTGASDVTVTVTFPRSRQLNGSLRIRLVRGGALVALGHARVRHGRARLTMRLLQSVGGARWQATLVLSRPHFEPVTIRVPVR